ncbi:DMT family transporter [Stenotrophomonas sp. PFBMAA-4]|uniref:DMT family transporter n=1 Tax=Stenotrophomonas sp. PFBMAA-4 TaxID=3043301 RepID=UPI0024B49FB8|nr:DMT family transporter [Stenotrophomonas sp. PFBMAA-4]MDI9272018.1 DMT family transporter [Stenotrophomonas sp. PFBMAA-4]
MRNNPMALGIANGVAAGALWGVVFLAPAVLHSFNALQLSAGRYLVYGLIAVILLLPRWRRLAPQLGRAEWIGLLWLSLAGNLVYFLLLATAVQWAGGAAASLIVGLIPVVVTLVGVREKGAVPLKQLLPALGLCVLGVALVGWESLMSEHLATPWRQRLIGLLCAFGALFSWALYSVGNSRWLARRADLSSHDWSLLTGVTTGGLSLLLVPMAFIGQTAGHTPAQWTLFWVISAGVAVIASIIGNAFWNRASRLLPLTLTGQMIVFETLFALLYAFAWQWRWPSLLEALAIVFLVAGVLLCAHAHRAPRAIAEHAG